MSVMRFLSRRWRHRTRWMFGGLVALAAVAAHAAEPVKDDPSVFKPLDEGFANWALDNHVPGFVWGVVSQGQLAHLQAWGCRTWPPAARSRARRCFASRP